MGKSCFSKLVPHKSCKSSHFQSIQKCSRLLTTLQAFISLLLFQYIMKITLHMLETWATTHDPPRFSLVTVVSPLGGNTAVSADSFEQWCIHMAAVHWHFSAVENSKPVDKKLSEHGRGEKEFIPCTVWWDAFCYVSLIPLVGMELWAHVVNLRGGSTAERVHH